MAKATAKKEKLKAKIAAKKGKIAAKKQKVRGAKVAALLVGLALLASGCATATPASRQTQATYDVRVSVDLADNAGNRSHIEVPVTFGDGAFQAADSAGSTETQTATPTLDIKPDIDVRYNDALAAASTASRGVIDDLVVASKNAVLALMQSGGKGSVQVQKTDGSTATVECDGGQCSYCTTCGEGG